MPSSTETFWRETLAEFSAPTPLGIASRALPGEPTNPLPAHEHLALSAQTTAALSNWAQQVDVTLSTIMQGAWALLLSRYSGERDVLFGITTSDRLVPVNGIDTICLTTLPLRIPVPLEAQLVPWLQAIQNQTLDLQTYASASLTQIQACSQVPQDLPLFESLLLFESSPWQTTIPSQHAGDPKPALALHEQTHYPLTLTFTAGETLSLRVRYDSSRFEQATIQRLLGHWQSCIEAFLAQPQDLLTNISILTSAEWQRQVIGWNRTQGNYHFARCLHQLIEQQVAQTPTRPAVFFATTCWSYAELNQRANRLAHQLQRLGVGPDVIVGVCAQRSLEMLLGLLAVLKAGGAYLPLDPEYPQERLHYMVQDAQVTLVLAQQPWDTSWPAACQCLSLRLEELDPSPDDENLQSGVQPEHLAYVIYTSGSTGLPKGTLIPHRAICNNLLWMQHDWPLDQDDRVLQKAPFTFDVSVKEFFWPLLAGAGLVIAQPGGHRDPAYLQQLIVEMEITVTHFVPSMLQAFLAHTKGNHQNKLRLVMCGAEALSVSLLTQFFQEMSAQLLHLYGPTEAAIAVTGWLCPRGQTDERVPLGYPMPNVQLYVLDASRQPQPIGIAGELYIGGAALARGYLNRVEETEEKFLANPFCAEAGARLYRTGDLARYQADGKLEFLGRVDHQVKLRGLRIELGEIEETLKRYPTVRESAVLLKEVAANEKRLSAFLVIEAGQEITLGPLRTFLEQKLPAYMVPASFRVLEQMPLSANGKVDRLALAQVQGKPLERLNVYTRPRSETERRLSSVWEEVLGRETIGIDDNFFELGGDSILAIQIIAKANRVGIQLTPKQIFEYHTIAEVAQFAGVAEAIQAEQGLVSGSVSLTPIQHWFFDRNLPDAQHYNDAIVLYIDDNLSSRVLEKAIAQLLIQHDALRLRFKPTDAGWQQVVASPDEKAVCSQIDLASLPVNEIEAAVAMAMAEAHASLNLAEGPLLRAIVFKLGSQKTDRLFITVHHLVIDGISWRILLEDLQSAYLQLSRGEVIQLPEKTTSFQYWAQSLKEYAQSLPEMQELRNWLALARIEAHQLPLDNPSGANTVAEARTVTVTLNCEETRLLLQEVPEVYHTQINDVLLTAFALAFRAWMGQERVLIDLEGHGREFVSDEVDLSRTIGWFTSIFPVQLDLAEQQDLGKSLKLMKECLRRIPKHGFSYGVIRYLCQDQGMVDYLRSLPAPLVSFNYLGQFDQVIANSLFSWSKESVGPTYGLRGERSHLLKVNGSIKDGELEFSWEFSNAIHLYTTIEALAHNFIEALQALISHCLSPEAGGYTPSDFPLAKLDQISIDRLLEKKCNIADIYPLSPMQHGMLFHALYEPQSGAYLEQLVCTLYEEVDSTAFQQAWQHLLERHPLLRTAFVWKALDEPLQIVHRTVHLPIEKDDWQGLTEREQQERLNTFLKADRKQGLNLANVPLMRVKLQRLARNSYQFIWSFHHILLDGWSFPEVLKEFFILYRAACRRETPYLKALAPYRNYIAWLKRQDLSQAETFWRETLAGFSAPTPLGIASRALPNEPLPDHEHLALSAQTTAALSNWAQQVDVTLSTIMQGAWALLLSRYSGERDVLFGITTSGRLVPVDGIDTMVGICLTTLPLRIPVPLEAQLVPWLQAIQNQTLDLQTYASASLVQIQACSQVPQDLPLFESLLLFESSPWQTAVQAPHTGDPKPTLALYEQTHYPLTLTFTAGETLSLRVRYDSSRFEQAAIQRLLGHWQSSIEAFLAQPQDLLTNISILTSAEWQRQVIGWNRTQGNYTFARCLHQLIEQQVAQTPTRPAVFFATTCWSYAELNQRANRLAHQLQRLGVGPDVIVGVCVQRSLEMLLGLLAILKAGGAYLPLDPEYPQERLHYMVQDAQVTLVLAQQPWDTSWPATCQCLPLHLEERDPSPDDENLQSGVQPEHLAYVIYTSGSTGLPKGTLIPHRAICNNLLWMQHDWPLDQDDRVLQKAPFTFDVSVKEFFWPLLAGAGLVIAQPGGHRDPAYLQQLIVEAKITVTHFVPSMLQAFLAHTKGNHQNKLRLVMCGAEALSVSLLTQFFQEMSAQLLHLYGPTEAAIAVTGWLCPRGQTAERVPLGYPMPNVQLYVLDASRQPQPIGIAGELYIGGAALARGYLNRVEETEEKFLANPFCAEAGARLYRTGDLARYQADGKLEFLGRVDHQVKLRGLRIELGEIEETLKRYPTVRESAVLLKEVAANEKRLSAFLVIEAGQEITLGPLRTFLEQKLPAYMVPASFRVLEQMPLSANGKVDRLALAQVQGKPLERLNVYTRPKSETERRLSGIWQEVLGRETIGIDDNFFELGGHSLLVTKLASRIYKDFNIELSFRVLFENITVAAQALAIERQQVNNTDEDMLSQMLNELDALSEEQVQTLLEQQNSEIEVKRG